MQSSEDEYRVLKYDLGHSLSGTKRTTPLLVERHAAWPGMFLVSLNTTYQDMVVSVCMNVDQVDHSHTSV